MAVAGSGVEDRHLGHLLERRLQPLPAARNDQVDEVALASQLAELLATAAGDGLDRALGERSLPDRPADELDEDRIRGGRRARTAKDGGVAALQAQRRCVDGHVRPRLVDDRDDADRDASVLHLDAAFERPPLEQLADRVLEGDHRLDPDCHRLDPLGVEPEPVEQGVVEPGIAAGIEVDPVGLEDRRRLLAQEPRQRRQRPVLVGGRDGGQKQRSGAGAPADLGHRFSRDRHGGKGYGMVRFVTVIAHVATPALVRNALLELAFGGTRKRRPHGPSRRPANDPVPRTGSTIEGGKRCRARGGSSAFRSVMKASRTTNVHPPTGSSRRRATLEATSKRSIDASSRAEWRNHAMTPQGRHSPALRLSHRPLPDFL